VSENKNKVLFYFLRLFNLQNPYFISADPRNYTKRHLEKNYVHQINEEAFLTFGGVEYAKSI
jgi:hypothetical protein